MKSCTGQIGQTPLVVPQLSVAAEKFLLWCELGSVPGCFTSHLATGGALNSEGGRMDVTHKGLEEAD